jgi:hypothetical protein
MWGKRLAAVAAAVGIGLTTTPVAEADPPPGVEDIHDLRSPNQTVVNSWGPAGYRLENWGASCGVGSGGTVTCTTYGQHGFGISELYGLLW